MARYRKLIHAYYRMSEDENDDVWYNIRVRGAEVTGSLWNPRNEKPDLYSAPNVIEALRHKTGGHGFDSR